MPIQKIPEPGWPHTEAAKYYDEQTHTILQGAKPPEPKKKRSGCCGGVLITLLIGLAIAGVIVAAVIGEMDESQPSGDDLEAATAAYVTANPGWEVETGDYPDEDGIIELVTWSNEYGIGRVVEMYPNEYALDGWVEEPLLPGDLEWTEPQFYSAFSDAFASTYWTYVSSVEPAADSSEPADAPSGYVLTYVVWEDSTGEWTEFFYTGAVYDGAGGWTVSTEATESAN